MKFEIHCHSCYSRGSKIPTEGIPRPGDIVRHAKSIGLSGIAITDHGTIKSWKPASDEAKRQGIMFIPAVELQTREGHLIALGINEPVENLLGFAESVEKIRDAGGIAVAPHPFDIRGEGVRMLAKEADAVEIFNSLNLDLVANRMALSKFGKSPIPKVVGSDAHTLKMIGRSVNIMEANDIDSVLKAIVKGRVTWETGYISLDEVIDWARERLGASKEEVMAYARSNYSAPKAWLYRKMLKKFLVTGNAPWRALAGISLAAVIGYGTATAFFDSVRPV
jgi:hypothetical protein